jgi:hypothetical protein
VPDEPALQVFCAIRSYLATAARHLPAEAQFRQAWALPVLANGCRQL